MSASQHGTANALSRIAARTPVLSYLVLCYGITWAVWFSIPLFAGRDWTLIKVMIGIGLGPGLAAVLLDRARGMAGRINARWCAFFAPVFFIVTAINLSSLVTGDGVKASDFAVARAPGLTAAGIVGSLLTASVCGFIFASAATSRSTTLNSIRRWRAPLRWWLIALFLPAALALLSFAIDRISGSNAPAYDTGGLSPRQWTGYVVRALLFTLFVVGIGEETGWRGWMLPELQKRWNPLLSSVFLGVMWGLWHFPLWIIGAYPGGPESVLNYVFLGPMMAILFTWQYNRTAGNLLLVLMLHTAINNTQRLVPNGELFPVLLLVLVIALIFTDRMWRRRVARPTTIASRV